MLSLVTAARTVGVAILTGALALAIPQQLPAQVKSPAPLTAVSTPISPAPAVGTASSGVPGPSVTVVNTSDNPVPVTVSGTVNINGSSTVNAQQSGAWNVGIVGNSATNPLQVHDVDNAPRTPYAQTKKLTFNGPDRQSLGNFDVPTGKRLVIESFSVFGKLPSGNKLV